MKKVILLAMFMPALAYGQIIENFENGTNEKWIQGIDGRWRADTSASISGEFSLHHIFDNASSGSDCIGLQLKDLHPDEGSIQWKFLIRHGYDPSSSNNWVVYLMSDTDPVSFSGGVPAKGFALGVNLTGYDDTLRLWKTGNSSVTKVITCPLNWQTGIGISNAAEICVERTETGLWKISVTNTGNGLLRNATGFDNELFDASWFILNYKYTSTRDRLIWLDDLRINGVFYEDHNAPVVKECSIKGKQSLEIVFNEEPSEDIFAPSNFISGDPLNHITDVYRNDKTTCLLVFAGEFRNKTENTLSIGQLCDKSGNCTENVGVKFTPAWAEAGDVLISEIMADPLPEVALPGKEYLEITNRSSFSYDLRKWRLTSGDVKTILPHEIINPGDYIILCSVADTAVYREYGRTIGLKPFPALTDKGGVVMISDSLGNLIHGVEYSSAWYGNKLKEGGGWSLEIIDKDFPFFTEGNWEASSSVKGGTPGKINSAPRTNQDVIFYGIRNVFPEDSITIRMQLSETVIDLESKAARIIIGDDPVSSVTSADPLFRDFNIKATVPFKKEQVYIIHLSGDINDFACNLPVRSNFRFGIPGKAEKKDIVFNELLFNPLPDDPDYIEFYNSSEKIIDVSRLYLASVSETGDTSEVHRVSDEPRCFIPGAFYAVTTDPDKTIMRYSASEEDNIFYVRSLPSMPDDRGHLLLLNREMDLIDEVIYSDEMHYSLLSGNEGISLEKVRPQLASDNSLNWHSASESSGWGTPGSENSAYCEAQQAEDQVLFSSGRISPDNDGYEDVLVIDFNLEGAGNVVTVTIFDETGGYVRNISENLYAGNRTSVIWDATADDGKLVNTGIYIILIELYNDKGKTKSCKKVCTVIRR